MKLFCTHQDRALIPAMQSLAAVAGIKLEVIDIPLPYRRSNYDDCWSEGEPRTPPDDYPLPDVASYGLDNGQTCFASLPALRMLPNLAPYAIPVLYNGQNLRHIEGQKHAPLFLPQDEAQIISLMTLPGSGSSPKYRRTEPGRIIEVRGVCNGVSTTPVAALLAATFASDLDPGKAGERATEPPHLPRVCLVDISGSHVPYRHYFATGEDAGVTWADLCQPGQVLGSRLAQALPRWQGVSYLSGAGFLTQIPPNQIDSMIRTLRGCFDFVVLDRGSMGHVVVSEGSDNEVWVCNCTLESLFAWKEVSVKRGNLVLWPEGPIPVSQMVQALRGRGIRPVALGAKHRYAKQVGRDGFLWPPPKDCRRGLEYMVEHLRVKEASWM